MKKTIFIVALLVLSMSLFAQTKKIQNMTFEDINGKKISTDKLLAKGPIVLDFWATFCAPCMKSLPAYNQLADKYPNVTFIAVSSDSPRAKDKVIKTVKSLKLNMTTVIDGNKVFKRLST
ncbi:MAG TPA: TlpA disulfide reductase family protein [Candidatus Cloacimonadota bacterium]|nr:TlpA disulfide reductase family protein [Candidatus Cloacimonadota bacterium]